MSRFFALLTSVPLFALILLLTAADWPQWRGPSRDGVSKEIGLLSEWPAAGPKLLWQVQDLGDGYSTPAVVGDRLYVQSNKDKENELVQALAASDGKEIWSTRLGKVGLNQGPQYPAARSTPTVEGGELYCLGSDGDLACLEKASGKIVWKKNLRSDFGGKTGNWAYSESPLIDGDVVVCSPGGSEATIVALDKRAGDTVWKCPIPEADQAAYASPIVVEAGGVKQYVQFLQKGIVGVEAKTGKLLWRYNKTAQGSPANIPTPVSRKSFVYSASGKGGAALVEIKAMGAAMEAAEIYFTPKLPSAIGGAIEHEGYLYGTTGQGLICADFATGEIKWQDRGVGAAALLYADGRIYLHGENGEVALVEATPDAYREKGRFTPPDQPQSRVGKAWAYPVVAGGRLYIRDASSLWCYDVQAK